MRISIPPETAFHLINHGPCNLIATGDAARRNIAPINWTMPVNNEPPLILCAVEEGTLTHRWISETREWSVNVVGEALADAVLSCGRVSGADVDKFAKFGLTPAAGKMISAPFLKESAGHLECRLEASHDYEGVTLFIGRVAYGEVEEEFWDGKTIRPEKVKSIHHLTGGLFAITERLVQAKKLP